MRVGGRANTARRKSAHLSAVEKLGLDIQYIGLDEPLTFGHYASRGFRPRQLPIDDVARRVAATISEIRKLYPACADCRLRGSDNSRGHDLAGRTGRVAGRLQASHRRESDAVAFDVDWRVRWLDWVRPGIEVLHSKGVHAGMLLTIAGPRTSDAGAVASLRANIQATEEARQPLDLIIVACWTPYPSLSLPASASDTLTSVLE